jgi:RHS repeat-associated protein
MDLNTGLTQALSNGSHTYVYGTGRISQVNGTSAEYFLGDALGSVRQLTNQTGVVTLTRSYDPYGTVTMSIGTGQTDYGYTDEYQSQELIYLRARMYAPASGRFQTRDIWNGDSNRPMSYNKWAYVEDNPVNRLDPAGLCWVDDGSGKYVWFPDWVPPCNHASSGYNGKRVADWAKANNDAQVPCPSTEETCTCFAASAANEGYDYPIFIVSSDAGSNTNYYRAGDFVKWLTGRTSDVGAGYPGAFSYTDYSNPFDDISKEYYGELECDETWLNFIILNVSKTEPGDMVAFQNHPRRNATFNHIAVVVDKLPNPKHSNLLWPVIVDQNSDNNLSPRFLGESKSTDISLVRIIFMGR